MVDFLTSLLSSMQTASVVPAKASFQMVTSKYRLLTMQKGSTSKLSISYRTVITLFSSASLIVPSQFIRYFSD